MLSSNDKVVWIEALRIYDGFNNGFLTLPSRLIADKMNVAHQTVARSLSRLTTLGFLEVTARSSFSNKCRKASEYRLTHLRCDRTGKLPTKQFMRPTADPHGNSTARDSLTAETVQSHP
jgi:Fe2+ or Zn2+ uptake regulation protein